MFYKFKISSRWVQDEVQDESLIYQRGSRWFKIKSKFFNL